MANVNTKQVKRTELKVGDVVRFHGARFEIYSAAVHPETDPRLVQYGPVMVAMGKWLDGETVPGYFGPDKDWNFQGNGNSSVTVEI